jgi:hypothetical protein
MRLLAALLALGLSGCSLSQARWAYVSGAAADLATTQYGLDHGISEANPLMAATGDPVLWSGVITAATIGVAEWAAQYDPKGATWFYRVFAVYRWSFAAVNLVRILEDDDDTKPAIDRKRKTVSAAVRVTF